MRKLNTKPDLITKKSHKQRTKIYTFKSWLEHFYVEVCGHYRFIGEKYDSINYTHETINIKNSYMSLADVKIAYKKYLAICKERILIESKFEISLKGYELTTNTWQEVDSLGISVHPETESINSITCVAKTANQAKHENHKYFNADYISIRTRRYPTIDRYILKNPEQYFPVLKFLTEVQLKILFNTIGGNYNKRTAFFHTKNEYIGQCDIDCHILINYGLMCLHKNILSNNPNPITYKLTEYGITVIMSLCDTKNLHYLYSDIQKHTYNGRN